MPLDGFVNLGRMHSEGYSSQFVCVCVCLSPSSCYSVDSLTQRRYHRLLYDDLWDFNSLKRLRSRDMALILLTTAAFHTP